MTEEETDQRPDSDIGTSHPCSYSQSVPLTSHLVLHGVVQGQRVQGPQPLHSVLGAHQSMSPPVTDRHTGHSAAVRLQVGDVATPAKVPQRHLPTARAVQQPAVGKQGHGGQRGVEKGQCKLLQRPLHCGKVVPGSDLEQAHRVLVGHRQVLLLGAGGEAEDPAEALRGGGCKASPEAGLMGR